VAWHAERRVTTISKFTGKQMAGLQPKGWKNPLELAVMTYSDEWMDGWMDDTSKTLIQSPSFSFI
jgi:hypothetical protein